MVQRAKRDRVNKDDRIRVGVCEGVGNSQPV